ncbi:MAG TPA: 3-hydroxyacyl-CoA dehydrogenase/enoyl-CoA hydratase family protein [Gaiellales bacterium]
MSGIERAAVIGAGTMGAGIAAHLANAGLPVVMLDLGDAAQRALAALPQRSPPALVSTAAARLIRTGSLERDLALVADADWIVEAIVEDANPKRSLYARLDTVRKPGSIVSSNTSTIPLRELLDGAPAGLAPDFVITHFFNPPRYMRLLEIVPGGARPEAVDALERVCDLHLGKTVVRCNDTPGFIANRLGVFWIGTAIGEALARGLTVEEADAVMGAPLGIPRSGVFGLMDIVGLGLHEAVTGSLDRLLPPGDAWHDVPSHTDLLRRMVAMGATGRGAGRGFYAREGDTRLAIDLATLEYRPAARPPRLPRTPRELVEMDGPLGEYASAVLGRTLAYAAAMVPDVTDRPELIDLSMQRGYGWERGPFELMHELDGGRPAGRARRGGGEREAIAGNDSASLWDTGDGVACLELHSKANAIDAAMLELTTRAVAIASDGHRALVVYSDGPHFSVGANLALVLGLANVAAWDRLGEFGAAGREAFAALKFGPVPVVGAVAGRALGGGCELLMHCAAVQAHTDTFMGLVELGAGLVPGWGGCRELLLRCAAAAPAGGPMPPARQAFEVIATARVSTSAQEARELGFLRPHDRITPNRDRLLADARAFALELADGYAPPAPATVTVAGRSGRATLELGAHQLALRNDTITAYDLHLAGTLAGVLTGGAADSGAAVPEATISQLEAAAVAGLFRHAQTLDRMTHLLESGRPLRN